MLSSGEISTNVRNPLPGSGSGSGEPKRGAHDAHAVRVVRTAMRALTLISPSLSSKWALRLLVSPRRHARPAREVRLLEGAETCDFVWGSSLLKAWSWGRGPVVLLLHGWEGRGAQLGAFVAPLVQAGFRVATFDGPAHGDSPGERMTPHDHADAARAFAEQLGGVHAVVAHSMGGLATCLALQEGLHTEKVVFVAPGSHPRDVTHRMAELLDLPPSVLSGTREALAAQLGTSWHLVDRQDPFANHESPLFVAHDVGDQDVPIEEARRICEAWGSAELYSTAGLGHRRILRDPDVVRRAVEFIGAPPHEVDGARQAFLRVEDLF